ncbi:MAG: FkbM family methyltransferase [Acidaminococcaceae bacterium]
MNLQQLTKNKGKLLEFVRLAKNLQANSYHNNLHSALSQEGCQVVFFCMSLPDDDKKLAKVFRNVSFHFCFPDELMPDPKSLCNIPVIKLSALKNFEARDNVLVLTRNEGLPLKFWDYFSKIGIKNILIYGKKRSYARVSRSLLLNLRGIYDVYNSLDVLSQEYYAAVLCGKISGDMRKVRFTDEKQYFLDGYSPTKGDIVIDGGAYDGMTAKAFCDIGCDVYSFEMDELNYQKGIELAKENNFILENCGLGREKIELKYKTGGPGSCISQEGVNTAKIIDIDTYANEKRLPRIDFIKMDIEGSEMDALQGSAQSIRKYKPKMAICTYHKLPDMWEILLYLKQLRPDYEFAFRHHIIDGGHEYLWNKEERELLAAYGMDEMCKSMWESVLYCR